MHSFSTSKTDIPDPVKKNPTDFSVTRMYTAFTVVFSLLPRQSCEKKQWLEELKEQNTSWTSATCLFCCWDCTRDRQKYIYFLQVMVFPPRSPCTSHGAVHAALTLSMTSTLHMKLGIGCIAFGTQSLTIYYDQPERWIGGVHKGKGPSWLVSL